MKRNSYFVCKDGHANTVRHFISHDPKRLHCYCGLPFNHWISEKSFNILMGY